MSQYQLTQTAKLSELLSLENDLIESTYLPMFLIKRFNQGTNTWKYNFFNLLNQEEFNQIDVFPKIKYTFYQNDIQFINSRFLADYVEDANDNLFQSRGSVYDVFSSQISDDDEQSQIANPQALASNAN